jgi:type IV secretory pathway VirB2 component (pilin)
MKQLPDDMLRQFWQDGKKEAPEGFSDFIMQNLPQYNPLSEALMKPLLSPRVAALLSGLLVVLAVLLYNLKGSDGQPSSAWYLTMQQWLDSSTGWLGGAAATLPVIAAVSVAIVLLIGLDRLLKRMLNRMEEG